MINFVIKFYIVELAIVLLALIPSIQLCFMDFCDCEFNFEINEYSIICHKIISYVNLNFSISDLDNKFRFNLKLADNNLDLIKRIEILNSFNLNSLDLSNNQNDFETYFESINKYNTLNTLNLSFNKISMIMTQQFFKLEQLKVLDLSYNEIFYFEKDSFFGLNNLLELYLNNNQLTQLESNYFNNLQNLKSINLDRNKIKIIRSKDFNALVNIQSISIRFNRIKSIEEDILLGLNNIVEVFLENNKLLQLTPLRPTNIRQIGLNFSKNHFSSIDLNNIIKNGRLSYLDFSFNNIYIISKLSQKNTLFVQTINLSNNKIKTLDSNVFQNIFNMFYLNLENNLFSELNSDIFYGLRYLLALNLISLSTSFLLKLL